MEDSIKKTTRPWHGHETRSIDQVYKSGYENGSINLIDKPDLSILSMNTVSNQIDKPQANNLVYKPENLRLENLRGNPLRIIRFLFAEIDNFNEKVTRKIQLIEIVQALEITRDSTRTGLRFLSKSKLISTMDYFPGLNGWTRYKIQEEIFNEIWSIDLVHKSGSKSGLSSSSSLLNTTTTNISQVLAEIDITPLEHIGFSQGHIQQVIKMNSLENLQESIYHFAFDLEHNEKWKNHKNPLNAFMAALRRGDPWTAENYISQRELAKRKQIAFKEAERKRLEELDKKECDLEFANWCEKLTPEQIQEIAPKKGMASVPQNVALSIYFKENIWPKIKIC